MLCISQHLLDRIAQNLMYLIPHDNFKYITIRGDAVILFVYFYFFLRREGYFATLLMEFYQLQCFRYPLIKLPFIKWLITTNGIKLINILDLCSRKHWCGTIMYFFFINYILLFKAMHFSASFKCCIFNIILTQVVPVSRRSGVLQWCEGTQVLSQYLIGATGAHTRYYPTMYSNLECRKKMEVCWLFFYFLFEFLLTYFLLL